MASSNHYAESKRKHVGFRLGTLLCVALGLFAALALSAIAADVTVNTSAYANNDITVNTINSGVMVIMVAETNPSTFNARTFVTSAYPLYAAADAAIVSMDRVIMVGWCAKKSAILNNTMSCLNGSKFNNDLSYQYVFIQMRFTDWKGSTVNSPSSVDLSSLKVLKQLEVSSFAGLYNPDKTTGTSNSDYITNVYYNTAAVYAVFGVLLAVVVVALILTCVCICRRDNAIANVNKSIIDNAIIALRSEHKKSRDGSVVTTNFGEHYNVQDNGVTMGPTPPPSSSPAVMPATIPAAPSQPLPREGSNTYSPTPESRAALEREMQEMKAQLAAGLDVSNAQKPVP